MREPDDEVQEALITPAEMESAILEGLAAQPIESWMTWLHPDQAPYVRRSYNGPVRIRGAAGTGKTVLGLHRAAWIASTRPGRVLVTSYVHTLPKALKAQYGRLSPQTADRVDFRSAHQFALDLLRERGTPLTPEKAAINAAYRAAWAEVGKPGLLKRLPVDWEYWKDEIANVIKGRAIFEFEDYARLERVGRRFRLGVEQRLAVWHLLIAYQQQLQARGVHDFADVFIYAEHALRTGPVPPYTAVVVDEVQDLPCVALRMFHHLVQDRPDGLLLIGDGQQSIYPGGFTLREAGIDVRGRAVVMRHNYRNTEEILAAARTIVSGDAFGDLDDLEEVGDREIIATRRGAPPVSQVLPDVASHEAAFLAAVRHALDGGARVADIAVLVPTNPMTERYVDQLNAVGIPAVSLKSYDGRPTDCVKVGTYHRSKGMEFPHVFLPQAARPKPQRRDETEDAYRERVELDRRTLFVAMTRARDTLWVGHVAAAVRGV